MAEEVKENGTPEQKKEYEEAQHNYQIFKAVFDMFAHIWPGAAQISGYEEAKTGTSATGLDEKPLSTPERILSAVAVVPIGEEGAIARGAETIAKDIKVVDETLNVASKVGQVAQGAQKIAQGAVDANKLNHIFGKAEHGLQAVVKEFGSQEAAYQAMQKATEATVKAQKVTGVFEKSVKVGTQTITVRGNVVDNVVKIGTAFK